MFKIFIFVIATVTVTSSAEPKLCNNLYKKYNIDLSIKSHNGWLRVINRNELSMYGECVNVTNEDKIHLIKCITNNKAFSRSIGGVN